MVSQTRPRSIKRATIKDVAQAAGVSVTTVSNVLNGRTEAMADETLQRIQATIRLLNYRPSRVARSLVTQQTGTVGVIIAEIDTPLFFQTLNSIETVAREADHNILLATTSKNLKDEPQVVDLLLEKRVDGIIILSTSAYLEHNHLLDLPPSMPPIVLINRVTPFEGRFDQIDFDHFHGVVNAVDYLAGLGHKLIAHLVGPENRGSTHDRLNGYKAGLEQHRLPLIEAYVVPGNFDQPPENWEKSTLELINVSPRPTAIIAANDRVAAVVMRTIQKAGLRVPEEISIIGIDNQPFCIYLNPALTTVQLPVIEAAEIATNMLLGKLSGQRAEAEQVILPCPLIVRESTGPVPEVVH
jgi:LacI family transcriptional regulator